eukprot:3830635-Pyramimonas_sp.AAC.1
MLWLGNETGLGTIPGARARGLASVPLAASGAGASRAFLTAPLHRVLLVEHAHRRARGDQDNRRKHFDHRTVGLRLARTRQIRLRPEPSHIATVPLGH